MQVFNILNKYLIFNLLYEQFENEVFFWYDQITLICHQPLGRKQTNLKILRVAKQNQSSYSELRITKLITGLIKTHWT